MKTPPLIPAWLLIATACAIMAALLITAGCATTDTYWRPSHAPVLVLGIVEVDRPCGRHDYDGCANYVSGMIELRSGMSPVLRDCVIRHERKHFAGFTHDERKGYATDCGDGSMAHF